MNNADASGSTSPHRRRWFKILLALLLLLILLLVAARIALPIYATHAINAKLADRDDFRGHIEDVDFHLFAGRMEIVSLVLYQVEQDATDQPTEVGETGAETDEAGAAAAASDIGIAADAAARETAVKHEKNPLADKDRRPESTKPNTDESQQHEVLQGPAGKALQEAGAGEAAGKDGVREALAEVASISCDWQWSDALRGEFVARITVREPRVGVVTATLKGDKEKNVQRPTGALDIVLPDIVPFTMTAIVIEGGQLRWHDTSTDPHVELQFDDIHIEILDLTNNPQSNAEVDLPSELHVRATLPGEGTFKLDGRFDVSGEHFRADFDMHAGGVHLPALNALFEAFANFDVEAGTLDLSAEVAVEDARVDGYMKVVMKGVDILRWNEEEGDGLFDKLWEALVGATAEILENQGEDTQAARVPISGNLLQTDTSPWDVFVSILKHAFVRALLPGVDDEYRWMEGREGVDGEALGEGKVGAEATHQGKIIRISK